MDTILLYSGGLDSFVSAGLLLEADPHRDLAALFIDYGQHTADREYQAAQACTDWLGVDLHKFVLSDYGPLVDSVPIVSGENVPADGEPTSSFFVPGRNIIFLLYAAIIGYGSGCRTIAYSPTASDVHSGDTQTEFIDAFQEALKWGMSMDRQVEPWTILTPVKQMTKAEEVLAGTRLGMPLELSFSCFNARERHCGICPNCRERQDAFKQAGVEDPTVYGIDLVID